jgi:hypothetical protein
MAHPRLESGDLITNARLSWLHMAGPRMAKERCILSDENGMSEQALVF